MSIYDNPDKYALDQTPELLAIELIKLVPITSGDVLFEPFKGEGSFYRNFPNDCITHWTEIKEGLDYKSFKEQVDWIITNPPYRMQEGKNCFIPLLFEFLPQVRKGLCFLCNHTCLPALTPLRQKKIEDMGFYISKITTVNVKKWFGRYYFIQITKKQSTDITYLLGNF